MTIEIKHKEAIALAAKKRADNYGLSHREVSAQAGVNKTQVTWILSDENTWKEHSISDAKWRNMAEWCGYTFDNEAWQIDRSLVNFKRFYNMAAHAHESSLMIILSEKQGRGKSTALECYRDDNPKSTFYLECDDSMVRKVFLKELQEVLGIDEAVTSVNRAIKSIVDRLLNIPKPLLELDEWNELPRGSKRIIKTIWNKTEGRLGIVICGGKNLAKDLLNGVEKAEQGYQELYSRGGGRIQSGKILDVNESANEAARICVVNGISEDQQINKIVNNYSGDIREVRRGVEEYQRILRKRASQDFRKNKREVVDA